MRILFKIAYEDGRKVIVYRLPEGTATLSFYAEEVESGTLPINDVISRLIEMDET